MLDQVRRLGDGANEGQTAGILINADGVVQTAHLKEANGGKVLRGVDNSLVLEESQGFLDCSVCRGDACEGEDHDSEPHGSSLIHRDGRASAVLDTVEKKRPAREVLDGLGGLLLGLEAFEETDVGTETASGAKTLDALLVTERLQGVGAGNEDKVRLEADAGGVGSSDAGVVLVARDHRLA